MTTTYDEVDVVIVGLGAAGGVAAHVLTQGGKDVVALEAGPRVDASMMTLDELRNDVRNWLATKTKLELPTWRTSPNETARPATVPILMVNAVGGSAVHYDGWSFRFPSWNFQVRSRTIDRYGRAAIPEGSTVADWPLTYEELEPYYDAVEYAIGVSGQASNLENGEKPGGNPFEPARARDYPMPALRRSGWNDLMAEGARSLGWHPFPVPSAINTRPYNGNPECTYCGHCQSNGCYRNAKGSLDVTLIPAAEKTGRLRVEPLARVVRIEMDENGYASGVTYMQNGREHFQRARVVLLGSYVYENIRLLLLSGSRLFPNGLSNNHDQVGRHYMAHLTPPVFGLFEGKNLNRFNGAGGQGTAVDDWNGDNFDHAGLGFIGGGVMTAMQELKPIRAVSSPTLPGVPRWGARWKAWWSQHARSLGSAGAQFENLSFETNVVDLDPTAKDAYGAPVVRVTHGLQENDLRGANYLKQKLEAWLIAAGATQTWSPATIPIDARHAYGGTRMGDDPAASVVDRYGFSHEVSNLGVIGASTYPTTGGYNPTLTLQALTWRTAQHLLDHWDARAQRSPRVARPI